MTKLGLPILIFLLLLQSVNCGKSTPHNPEPSSPEKELKGVVLIDGKAAEGVYITNISRRIRTRSDGQGRFSIISDEGDKILFESENRSKFIVVNELKDLKVELEQNARKAFYLKNFEADLIQGDIFVLIPSTDFISPVLSNGMVIFTYPADISEAVLVTKRGFCNIKISDVEDFSVIDLKQLKFVDFPEYVSFTNLARETITAHSYWGHSFRLYPGETTYVPPGIYKIRVGDDIIENILALDFVQVSRGMINKDQTAISVRGIAKTATGETDVLIWVEGTGIILRAHPEFRLDVPLYSKRIHFSKAGWYPQMIELQDDIKDVSTYYEIILQPQTYITGFVLPFGVEPRKFQITLVDTATNKEISNFTLKNTDFVLIAPQGRNLFMSISSSGYIPKGLEIYTYSHHIDVGHIYLCSHQNETCIFEEGKRFLKYALHREAREAFSYLNSVSGKIGLFISDLAIILSDERFFSLSEEAKKKSFQDLQKIYDEIEDNLDIDIDFPVCLGEVRMNIPIFVALNKLAGALTGCIGKSSFEFFKGIYKLIRFAREYIYSHKLFESDFSVSELINLQYLIFLTRKLIEDDKLLMFSDHKSDDKIELLKDFFSTLHKTDLQRCDLNDEMICLREDFICVRIVGGCVPFARAKARYNLLIESLSGNYEVSVSDVLQMLPTNLAIPNFAKINLKKLFSNPLRKFLPAVLHKDSGVLLGIEAELPSNLGELSNHPLLAESVGRIFSFGESKHFRVMGEYLLDYDGLFPHPWTSTQNVNPITDMLLYFYFDDPTFGESIKVSPCAIALSETIHRRYSCPSSDFYPPDNQMLNDVLSSLQKITGTPKLLFGKWFDELLSQIVQLNSAEQE